MRYLSSFFLTSFLYVSLATIFLFANPFENLKEKEKREFKKVSLNHVEIVRPKPIETPKKVEKVEEIKEVEKVVEVEEKKIEPIVESKVIEPKKEKPKQKKIIKEKVVKKLEPKKVQEPKKLEEVQKIVEEKVIEKPIVKQEPIVKNDVLPKVDYEQDFLRQHLKLIKNEIQKNVKYSQRARKLNIEGNVIIEFCLTKAGEIVNVKTIQGHKLLQKSTIDAIYSALNNFPKVQKNITIRVPIEYKLI